MPYNHYLQISKERYDLLCQRFEKYILEVDDINKNPFKLFDPLNAQQVQELELIREVSKYLQINKEEDKKKTTALKAEQAAKEKKEAENTEKEIEKPTEVSSVEN